MKKMLLVMAAAALVAGDRVQAQSETVTSVNVVGYYTVTIPANGAALVTPVLDTFDGVTVKELLGDQIPGGVVYIWSRTNSQYVIAQYDEFDGNWAGAGASKTLMRGDALWVVPPKDGSPHTVAMMGEVPADSTSQVLTVGKDAVGYSYPVDIEWTATQLAKDAPYGSILYLWNMNTSTYSIYQKDEFEEAWTTPAGLKIKAGEAFWIVMPTTFAGWTEPKPYTL
jgi:hypothetical protein